MKKSPFALLFVLLLAASAARGTDYYLRGNDANNQCSFNGTGGPVGWAKTSGGDKFSDGPSDPTGVYHVNGYLVRINLETATSLTFTGGEFVMDRNQSGNPSGAGEPAINHKMAKNSLTTIPKLRVPTGSRAELRQGGAGASGGDGSNKNITGTNWVVEAGAELCFNIGEGPKANESDTHRYWTCSATIFGEGLVSAGVGISETRVWDTTASDPARTSGSVTLTGDLSAFAGVLSAGEKGVLYTGTRTHEEVVSGLSLVIGATNAMPQATPGGALLRGAMVVTNGATISFTCDATSPTNRGWTFGSGAVPKVDVASGKTVTIEGPVEGTVGFRKTGAGTLVLNVGGAGEYGTLTLEGEQTVSAAQLVDYVARCEAWIAGEPLFGDVSFSSAAETSASFSVEVLSLGRDATEATLSALVREASAGDPWSDADAEAIALSALDAATNGVFRIGGLDPDTAYQVRFVLSRDLVGTPVAATNDAVAFATAPIDHAPTVVLSESAVYAAAADLAVAVPRFGYGATAISSLVLRYGTDPADESSWTTTNLVPPATEGGSVSCRLLGLATGTTYHAKVVAANDLNETFETAVFDFTPSPPRPATVETTGENVTTTVLDDLSTVVHFLGDGTFTLAEDTDARLLLVGGGGSGGWDCGGGGGAGGMIEIASETLAAGTYGVTVGAGGQPGNKAKGENGGDTVLTFGDVTNHVATGGGAGGIYDSSNAKRGGASGGSGGGGANHGAGGAGIAGQGNAGGGGSGSSGG
ncbi:MAG: hypothetical protein IJL06_09745, partial [Kiritimatiellae bacterium]|nr:hypothetical protein [Kiritimatiellia bacterium]